MRQAAWASDQFLTLGAETQNSGHSASGAMAIVELCSQVPALSHITCGGMHISFMLAGLRRLWVWQLGSVQRASGF